MLIRIEIFPHNFPSNLQALDPFRRRKHFLCFMLQIHIIVCHMHSLLNCTPVCVSISSSSLHGSNTNLLLFRTLNVQQQRCVFCIRRRKPWHFCRWGDLLGHICCQIISASARNPNVTWMIKPSDGIYNICKSFLPSVEISFKT